MTAAEEAELSQLRLAEVSLRQRLVDSQATLRSCQVAERGGAAERAALLSQQHLMQEQVRKHENMAPPLRDANKADLSHRHGGLSRRL